jgi:hypothetical protein
MIKLCWVIGNGLADKLYTKPLLWDGTNCVPLSRLLDNSSEDFRTTEFFGITHKASATEMTRLLGSGIFKEAKKEREDKVDITVSFGANDNWKDLSALWVPSLLSGVNRFILEVRHGNAFFVVLFLAEL